MSRGRRFLAQIALLIALFAFQLLDENLLVLIVGACLIPLPVPIGVIAALYIWASRLAPEIESLREQADDLVTYWLGSMGFAAAGVITVLRYFEIPIPGRPVVTLIAWVGLLVAIPALARLRLWRRLWFPLIETRLRGRDSE